MWWYPPAVAAHGRQRHRVQTSKDIFSYRVNLRSAWANMRPCRAKKKKKDLEVLRSLISLILKNSVLGAKEMA